MRPEQNYLVRIQFTQFVFKLLNVSIVVHTFELSYSQFISKDKNNVRESVLTPDFKHSLMSKGRTYFLRLPITLGDMQSAGVRDRFLIRRYCLCQRAINLQIALKPA
jgi:hypothetical protein